MLLGLFLLFSVPLGVFCLFLAWRAWQVGRKQMCRNMSILASLSFSAAVLAGGWTWVFLNR